MELAELQARLTALQEENARLAEDNAFLRSEMKKLLSLLAELQDRLASKNSKNSSLPPSHDPPGTTRPQKPKTGRKPGGQPGHKGHKRALLPPEKVSRSLALRPSACSHCHAALRGDDPAPFLHQVVELPQIRPFVTEYQLHKLVCPSCHTGTRARLPKDVPTGAFGPRLSALIALLSGHYHLPRRATQELLSQVLDIELSLGSVSHVEERVSETLAQPVQEAQKYARAQTVRYVDETGYREGPKKRCWLWVLGSTLVSVFQIKPQRSGEMAKELMGEGHEGITVTDRYGAYSWLLDEKRQLCWAHVLRDFQWLSERGGMAGFYGEKLLSLGRELFHDWHEMKQGRLSRERFEKRARGLERDVGYWLKSAADLEQKRVSGMCRELLRHEKALWTFVSEEGVEPTNNEAERALRTGVVWRKISFGTWSKRGSRFVERLLTVVGTLKKQKRNVLEYLTSVCQAALRGEAAPSLLPDSTPSALLTA